MNEPTENVQEDAPVEESNNCEEDRLKLVEKAKLQLADLNETMRRTHYSDIEIDGSYNHPRYSTTARSHPTFSLKFSKKL